MIVNWIGIYVTILNCTIMSIPSTYLGKPIRGNPRKLRLWDNMIQKIKKRLTH